MSNQYEVLGKAPGPEDLKNLSSEDIHLTIKIWMLDMVKWKFYIILIYL